MSPLFSLAFQDSIQHHASMRPWTLGFASTECILCISFRPIYLDLAPAFKRVWHAMQREDETSFGSNGIGDFRIAGECLDAHAAIAGGRQRYVLLAFPPICSNPPIRLTVLRRGLSSQNYDDFLAALPLDNACVAVYAFDLPATTRRGSVRKLMFMMWVPDCVSVRTKMVMASSKDWIKRTLAQAGKIDMEVGGTDLSEVDYDSVLERVSGR